MFDSESFENAVREKQSCRSANGSECRDDAPVSKGDVEVADDVRDSRNDGRGHKSLNEEDDDEGPRCLTLAFLRNDRHHSSLTPRPLSE